MTIVRRNNPLGELLAVRRALERLFEDGEHQLPLNIHSASDELVVEAALTGIRPDDTGDGDQPENLA